MKVKKYIIIILLSIVLYFTFVILRFKHFNFDPSFFILVGEYLVYDPNQVVNNITVIKNSGGYDGQYYYRLALNPFANKRYDFGIILDAPSYRSQRIVYPLLVWLFSFGGKKKIVPYMMIFINFLCLSLFVYFVNLYLQNNQDTWLNFGLVFYPGFILTLSRSLPEIVAVSFVSVGLYLLKRNKILLSSIFMFMSVLAKETTFVIPAVLVIMCLYNTVVKKKSDNKYLFIIPLIGYLIWIFILYSRWKNLPFIEGSQNFTFPFHGIKNYISSLIPPQNDLEKLWLVEIIFVLIFSLCTLFCIKFSSVENFVKVVFIIYFLMMIHYSETIWVEDWAFLRAITEMVIFGWLILLNTPKSFNIIKLPVFMFEIFVWSTLFLIHIKGL